MFLKDILLLFFPPLHRRFLLRLLVLLTFVICVGSIRFTGALPGLGANNKPCPSFFKEKIMPLDLVGRLHRTVYVESCDQSLHEDLAKMMLSKCGAVEAWESLSQRMTVVFSKLDSMDNALRFNGMMFGMAGKPIVVWAANATPPAGHEQLMLGGPAGPSCGAGPADAEAAAAKKRRLEMLQSLSEASSSSAANGAASASGQEASMTAAEKRFRLLTMTMRQVVALVTLTEAAMADLQTRVAETTRQLEATEGLALRLEESNRTA
jgi:hypothetical protein